MKQSMNLCFLLFIAGCNLLDPPTHVSDDLQIFAERVVYEYEIRGVKVEPIKVVFGDLDGKNGRFEPFPPWDKKIIVSREYYADNIEYFPEDIQKTVAHEFGHYMGRDHKKREWGCIQKSLMCTECCVSDLEEKWQYYFDELVGVTLDK
jgi:hypothetical protein